MKLKRVFLLLLPVFFTISGWAQHRKLPQYAAPALREDLVFLYEVLERAHPSLYWYTPEQEMKQYFSWALQSVSDSMNEIQFRNLVSFAVSKIRCGHTSVKPSKPFQRYYNRREAPFFPYLVRVWNDTMAITHSLKGKNDTLPRGTRLLAINGTPVKELLETLYEFMPLDGYSSGVNEIRLSFSFPYIYGSVFGNKDKYTIGYEGNTGLPGVITEEAFRQEPDSVKADASENAPPQKKRKRISRKERLLSVRSLRVDSVKKTGILEINSFAGGTALRKFYRQSFRTIERNGIQKLVVDVRENGGGNLKNYILLTRYLRNTPFKVADSISSITRKLPFRKQIEGGRMNEWYMLFTSRKKSDGRFHFTYFEKHYFNPKKKNHFSGKLCILTSGQTFSAATLFTAALKGQKNCTIVGEETGGGAYGNNGMLISDITLPHTGVRVTLPLYRMVINRNAEKGRGVLPDIEVKPTIEGIQSGTDMKMRAALRHLEAD